MDTGAERYAAYLDGDREAVGDLVKEYYDGLSRYLFGFVHDRALAGELAEDAFVVLVTKKPRYVDNGASFRSWLYGIGRKVALDRVRRDSKRSREVVQLDYELPGTDDIESAILEKEENGELYLGLLMLKSEYREALWLTYFEDLPLKEVAIAMHRSESSVEHLVRRGKYALRKELTDRLDGGK